MNFRCEGRSGGSKCSKPPILFGFWVFFCDDLMTAIVVDNDRFDVFFSPVGILKNYTSSIRNIPWTFYNVSRLCLHNFRNTNRMEVQRLSWNDSRHEWKVLSQYLPCPSWAFFGEFWQSIVDVFTRCNTRRSQKECRRKKCKNIVYAGRKLWRWLILKFRIVDVRNACFLLILHSSGVRWLLVLEIFCISILNVLEDSIILKVYLFI